MQMWEREKRMGSVEGNNNGIEEKKENVIEWGCHWEREEEREIEWQRWSER